jgi:hypothetical protein
MQTLTTLKTLKKSPVRQVTLRLRRSNTNQANYNSLTRKLKNNLNHRGQTDSLNQSPIYDYYLTVDEEDSSEYNDGTRMIQQSEKRATYYTPHFKHYMHALDDTLKIEDTKIRGLIIHYPGQSALALDHTTELQYSMFPAITAVTTDVNQPILLITTDGFQHIKADDIRNKYHSVLEKLFTKM